MNTYALESKEEVARLEEQNSHELYDYRKELSTLVPLITGPVLDAGCGSGLLSRFIAGEKPQVQVTGCDFSSDRINGARQLAKNFSNIEIVEGNLLKMPFKTSQFQSAFCRFVLEYFSAKDQQKVVNEIFRCLKPGGYACLIDIDGMYHNLFPRPKSVDNLLKAVKKTRVVDLKVARRLPSFLTAAGFQNITWNVELMDFQGKNLEIEMKLMNERFDLAQPLLAKLLGSKKKAVQVQKDFIEAMNAPGAVLYYNKVIAIGQKPPLKAVD